MCACMCVSVCERVCVYLWGCMCVWAAQLVGDREGRNVYGWFTAEPLRTVSGPGTPDNHWCCSVDRNPAEPISAMETACESHSFSDIMTHCIVYIRCCSRAFLAHAVRVRMKISPQCEQRVPEEVRGECKKGVCELVTLWFTIVELCTWTLSLVCISALGKRLSWMAGVQTSRLCCWRLMENHHLCQAACQGLPASSPTPTPPPPPPRSPLACRAGLSSNYIW